MLKEFLFMFKESDARRTRVKWLLTITFTGLCTDYERVDGRFVIKSNKI